MNLKKTRSHLAMLEKKHAQTDSDIIELQGRAGFCATEVRKLKAEKLHLKEKMKAVRVKLAAAESISDTPDESSGVPAPADDSQQHESVGAAAAA